MSATPSRRAGLTARAAALASATALAATACTSGTADPQAEGGGDWKTVTVDHAFGSTEIGAEPERIVTVGWSDEAALLEMGIVPVGMAASTYAGDEDGYLPWDLEKIEELGGEKPELINTDDGLPVEEIAALEPDLILGVQSGMEKDEYEQLSGVAPTVPYLDQPWMTPWQDEVRTIGEAVGRPDDADKVVADTESYLDGLVEEHPEFEGATFAAGTLMPDTGELGFYINGDPRNALLEQLGLTPAPFLEDIDAEKDAFYGTISQENAEDIDADVLVMWFNTPEDRETLEDSGVFGRVRAVKDGGFVGYEDHAESMAISSPNPLSIPWVMDGVTEDLSKAVEGKA
ncbi:iron-siderophore ABC transporter substrate-binding protein [Nocardiopsis sp. RSe5-2]|uniref:Iron-siderophore ABC transporter substrate-binding protein n=1 Tax=Nocardiopsis endophytica TaxID=3018445 RepID=A0ABT4UD90_9ACTN|nr:iron-siderophore ABC transporter substrate-binding protein [Nocardiopsis endophytica]MDA2814964.1 iron-siderophore ABC transporter substrate-binding protein [Nocardiopsis endophytica]